MNGITGADFAQYAEALGVMMRLDRERNVMNNARTTAVVAAILFAFGAGEGCSVAASS